MMAVSRAGPKAALTAEHSVVMSVVWRVEKMAVVMAARTAALKGD
jgi:hypothetical protein